MDQYTLNILIFNTSLCITIEGDTTVQELLDFVQQNLDEQSMKTDLKDFTFSWPNQNNLPQDNSQTIASILKNLKNAKIELIKKQKNSQGPSANGFVSHQSQNSSNQRNEPIQINQYPNAQVQPSVENIQSKQTQFQQQYQYGQQKISYVQQPMSNEQLPYQQQQQNQINEQSSPQPPQQYNQTYNITLKYQQNQLQKQIPSKCSLDELFAQFIQEFQFDGEIEMFCGNKNLSKLNFSLSIAQAGVDNNSTIEIKQSSQMANSIQIFYENMKFEEVQPQQSSQSENSTNKIYNQSPPIQKQIEHQSSPNYNQSPQIQNFSPQIQDQNFNIQPQPIYDRISIECEIKDGGINRTINLEISIQQTLASLIHQILQYLNLTDAVAAVDLIYKGTALGGQKLQCSFQQLQMPQNISIQAKIRYFGGTNKGIIY